MLWIICLVLGSLVIVLSVTYAAFLSRRKQGRFRGLRSIHLLIGGCFLASLILQIPVLRYETERAGGDVLKAVILSLHSTLQIFTLNSDRSIVLESIGLVHPWMCAVYSTFLALLFAITPLLTFGFLLSFFRNASAQIRYQLHWFSDIYAFSCLNEKALCLAKDLKTHHPDAVLVFCGIDRTMEKEDLSEEARALNAICFREGIRRAQFFRHSARARICIFLISSDKSENAVTALPLIRQYQNRENTSLYVFAAGAENELMLNGIEHGVMKIRRVSEASSFVYQMLNDEGYRLFETAGKPSDDGCRKIGTVVVGMDTVGMEMACALTWFGQMDGYKIEIDVFDEDEKAEDHFAACFPGLTDHGLKGSAQLREALYSLRVHGGADAETQSFLDEVCLLQDTTCVLISLGNSTLNIRTAVRLRIAFERIGIHPMIITLTGNLRDADTLRKASTQDGIPYDIFFIDEMKYSYSEQGILQPSAEKEALELHMRWGKEEDFWAYEYNYRSSMAAVIHQHVRERILLQNDEPDQLARLEHRRWEAYMQSEGYIYGEYRNDLTKTHPDMVNFDMMAQEAQDRESRISNKQE